MIKLKSIIESTGITEKYFYRGTCVSILDQGTLFDDATQMAQTIENASSLTYADFLSKIFPRSIPDGTFKKALLKFYPDKFEFGAGIANEPFAYAYDTIEDIHYFFT